MKNTIAGLIRGGMKLIVLGLFVLPSQVHPQFIPSKQLIVKLGDETPLTTRLDQGTTLAQIYEAVSGQKLESRQIRPLFAWLNGGPWAHAGALASYYVIDSLDSRDPGELHRIGERLTRHPGIDLAFANHRLKVDNFVPNDPQLANNSWPQLISAFKAWDLTRGSADVIIAIIDTGLDYLHEDISNQIWTNSGETGLDGLGQEKQSNGVDDDGNGFIDDWQGWDFVDAPGYPDNGDYLDQDNDPMDDNGHGTSVGGIAAAQGNNALGVAGLAFESRLMNVRAGTQGGFLEEDDVAQAIVYAVVNGARVLNLSFGDTEFTPLLHDAVKFAFANNCIVIASAGNTGSQALHYPSAFYETISVGATNNDNLASFSNTGATIDLTAPGVNLHTTKLDGSYGLFSGTSASAPLVSALAALLTSHNADLTSEQVRAIMKTSAVDLGTTGRDHQFGAGRINAFDALQVPYTTVARIDLPRTGTGTAANILHVIGTAAGTFLKRFSMSYGVGLAPDTWIEVANVSNRQIVEDTLASLDLTSVPDGTIGLRLVATNHDGSVVEDQVIVSLDRTAPQVSSVDMKKMFNGVLGGVLISFDTDDICNSALSIRLEGSTGPFLQIPITYSNTRHSVFLQQQDYFGAYEFFITATNPALAVTNYPAGSAYLGFQLIDDPIPSRTFLRNETVALPKMYLLNKATDLDQDGQLEIIGNQLTVDHKFSSTRIFEFDSTNGQIAEVVNLEINAIPRDAVVNLDNNLGLLLLGAGSSSFIYQSSSPTSLPTISVFSASEDFFGVGFNNDLNLNALTLIVQSKLQSSFDFYEDAGNNNWTLRHQLINPTGGDNLLSVPLALVEDFDNDGNVEMIAGDFGGDLFAFEWDGTQYVNTWSHSRPLTDAGGFLASGDFDGDGIVEFVAGSHTADDVKPVDRHWNFAVFKSNTDNSYDLIWQQDFYGAADLTLFQSGVTTADLNGDGRDELLLSLYPNLYVLEYDSLSNSFKPIWTESPVRSNIVLVADLNGDDVVELYFNNGTETVSYSPEPPAELPEVLLEATPIDTNQIRLDWIYSTPVDNFEVYRGTHPDSLSLAYVISPEKRDTVDTQVQEGLAYYYSIRAVSGPSNSLKSRVTSAIPNKPPSILGFESGQINHMRIDFSEPMDAAKLTLTSNYRLDSVVVPSSAIPVKSGHGVLLTFDGSFSGDHTLTVSGLTDLSRTPLASTTSQVQFPAVILRFNIVRADFVDQDEVDLVFSQPLNLSQAENAANYSVEPGFSIIGAAVNPAVPDVVRLSLSAPGPIGSLGTKYVISAYNLVSQNGALLDETNGNTTSLLLTQDNLSDVFVFPNPYRFNSGPLTFGNLPPGTTILIYDLQGVLIRRLHEEDSDGGTTWDLRNRQGELVSSGIYLFRASYKTSSKQGKFVILR